jgi:type IV pilus assembly protein PilV
MTKGKIACPGYPASAHAGFTLIEALVALALMSIGLLGIAGLQLAELRVSKNTLQASQAAALAYSLADMMRANAAATNAGEYDFDPAIDSPPDAASTADCSKSCSPVELARFDFAQWYAQVVGSLPSANVRVVCEAAESGAPCPASGAVRTITVFWNPSRASSAAPTDFSCGAIAKSGQAVSDSSASTCVAIGLQP